MKMFHTAQPIPINLAEAIIEPFWAPELSGLERWAVDPGVDHGLKDQAELVRGGFWVGSQAPHRTGATHGRPVCVEPGRIGALGDGVYVLLPRVRLGGSRCG